MTTKNIMKAPNIPTPAPMRLVLDNLQFERRKDQEVKVFSSGDRPLCTIHKDDWYDVGDFFRRISKPGAKL